MNDIIEVMSSLRSLAARALHSRMIKIQRSSLVLVLFLSLGFRGFSLQLEAAAPELKATETQARFQCGVFLTHLSRHQAGGVLTNSDLRTYSRLANLKFSIPTNPLIRFYFNKFTWPATYVALEKLERAILDQTISLSALIEWVKAERGSNPEARAIRALFNAIMMTKKAIDGGDVFELGSTDLEALERTQLATAESLAVESKASITTPPSEGHTEALAEVKRTTAQIEAFDKQITALQKPPSQAKISFIGDKKLEAQRAPSAAVDNTMRIGELRVGRTKLVEDLTFRQQRLDSFETASRLAIDSAAAKLKQARTELEKTQENLREARASLQRDERKYLGKSTKFAVKSLFQYWGVFDAYSEEKNKRLKAKQDAEEVIAAQAARQREAEEYLVRMKASNWKTSSSGK